MSAQNKATEIREIALRILEKEGADAVSMRRVAKAAKITPMAIYHYFVSREALLQDVANAEFDKHVARLQSLHAASNPETRLAQIMDSFLDYAIEHPRVYDYVFTNPRPGARRYPDDFQTRKSPTFNLLMDAVSAAIKTGAFRKENVFEISLTIAAHSQGLITLYRGGRFTSSEKEFRQLCKKSFSLVLDGLRR